MHNQLNLKYFIETFRQYISVQNITGIDKISHPLFWSDCLYIRLQNEVYFGFAQTINNNNFIEKIKKFKLIIELSETESFLSLKKIIIKQKKQNQICLYLLFECFDYTLEYLFLENTTQTINYQIFLESAIRALAVLEIRKISHGHLNYYSFVFVKNQLKLIYNPDQPNTLEYYECYKKKKNILFFSPEELNSIKNKSPFIKNGLSDVYVLGKIFLNLGLGRKQITNDPEEIEGKLSLLKKESSSKAWIIIQKMLRVDPEDRIEFLELSMYMDSLSANQSYQSINNDNQSNNHGNLIDFRGTFNPKKEQENSHDTQQSNQPDRRFPINKKKSKIIKQQQEQQKIQPKQAKFRYKRTAQTNAQDVVIQGCNFINCDFQF